VWLECIISSQKGHSRLWQSELLGNEIVGSLELKLQKALIAITEMPR
jgi:hypothetical protein